MPGAAEIYLDGKLVASGDRTAQAGNLVLAQGLHNLKVRAQVRTTGTVQLLWGAENTPARPVPGTELFSAPVERQGLEGSYFSDIAPEGLKFVRIDPFPGGYMHILPLSIPFSIRWQGQIELSARGSYRFVVQAVDAGSLTIDGKQLLSTQAPNQPAEATIELDRGRSSGRDRLPPARRESNLHQHPVATTEWRGRDGTGHYVSATVLIANDRLSSA